MSDKVVKMTNYEMTNKIGSLQSFLDRKDIVGYAAARNMRRLGEAEFDHEKIKIDLLNKYGTNVLDENGVETGQMRLTSDNEHFAEVSAQLDISGNTEHEVTIFTISYEDVFEKLTGNEILQIDWMIDDN